MVSNYDADGLSWRFANQQFGVGGLSNVRHRCLGCLVYHGSLGKCREKQWQKHDEEAVDLSFCVKATLPVCVFVSLMTVLDVPKDEGSRDCHHICIAQVLI